LQLSIFDRNQEISFRARSRLSTMQHVLRDSGTDLYRNELSAPVPNVGEPAQVQVQVQREGPS